MARRRKRSSKRRGRNGTSQQMIPHPPQFDSTRHVAGRARFLTVGAVSGVSITRAMLLNHLVMNSASGTANYRLFSAFKLKSIEMWSATSSGTVAVEWRSTYGPSTIVSDTTLLTAVPGHIRASPPINSLASYWSLSGSNESDTLFIIDSTDGSIVDITYEAVLQNGEAATLATTTASGSVGVIYMTYLAGVTTTTFKPISYISLT